MKQIEGINYCETSARTSKPETFRLILSLAAKKNLHTETNGCKVSLLISENQGKNYLEQLSGSAKLDPSGQKLVCRLNKSFYGWKPAAKNWYGELTDFLFEQNFVRSKNDYCLFSKYEKGEKLFLPSWVVDLFVAESSLKAKKELKKTLETKFRMDNRGKLESFLGFQINEDSEKIYLDQETYIESVVEKFSMQDSNTSKTPAEKNFRSVKATEVEALVHGTLYRSLVGSLLYIPKQTRPHKMSIVNVLSRFMDKPANSYWLAGKRVLHYLRATKLLKLVYPRDNNFNLTGKGDKDWSGDHDDRRSTTCYFFKLRLSGGAVSWQTVKQQTVALNSCEAEYQGLAAAVEESNFLTSLMRELCYQQMQATVIG